VVRVVDGDTIELSNGKKVRYIGIDTPETVDPRKAVQCFGKDASQANKDLVLNKTVILKKDISDTDRYGRLLRYVYLEDGTFVNLWLVKNGFATAYTYPPDVYYSKDFVSAEKEAREKQLGLWSPNTCNGDTTNSASNASTQTTTQTNTGKYYTSSYRTSKYYYPEACSAWKGLSPSYLKSFDTLEALLKVYPSQTLSPQCQ